MICKHDIIIWYHWHYLMIWIMVKLTYNTCIHKSKAPCTRHLSMHACTNDIAWYIKTASLLYIYARYLNAVLRYIIIAVCNLMYARSKKGPAKIMQGNFRWGWGVFRDIYSFLFCLLLLTYVCGKVKLNPSPCNEGT